MTEIIYVVTHILRTIMIKIQICQKVSLIYLDWFRPENRVGETADRPIWVVDA